MMRVFIADDEEIIRDGIRNCIEKEQERFLFAGEAPDGEMALPMLMEMKPDVLITDIRMPFMDGLELAKVERRSCLKRLDRLPSRLSRSSSSFARKVQTAAANTRRTCCVSIFSTTCSRAACRLRRRLYRENAGGCC